MICLNPTSSLHPLRAVDPREWGAFVFRRASGRRLGSEAKKLRIAGTPTVLVQPLEEDLRTMSRNLMSTRNRNAVIEVARATVAAQLRAPDVAELLAELPAGRPEKVTRPDLPPAEWPPLGRPSAARSDLNRGVDGALGAHDPEPGAVLDHIGLPRERRIAVLDLGVDRVRGRIARSAPRAAPSNASC